MISLILGALPTFNLTKKALRRTKSEIDEFATQLELLHVIVVHEIIILIADLYLILFSLNLNWFLQNQIVFMMLTIAATMTILQRGDQFLWLSWIASCKEKKVHCKLMMQLNQCQIEPAKEQSKNKWEVVSWAFPHKLHIEGRLHPLKKIFSSIGILLCKLLHTIVDFEGGTTIFHMHLAQAKFWPALQWNWYASLKVKPPSWEWFQIYWSSLSLTGITISSIKLCKFGKICNRFGGMFQAELMMNWLTDAFREECKSFGILRAEAKGEPHQESIQNWYHYHFQAAKMSWARLHVIYVLCYSK